MAGLKGCRTYVCGHWGHYLHALRWRPLLDPLPNEEPLPTELFYRLLLDSKIHVSPWGIGEACFKDYEALYAGCVLVKPDSSHCRTWPETYINGFTYVPCAYDYSDLQGVVDSILRNYDAFMDMRLRNRRMLLEARRQFPSYYAGLISDIVNSYRA